MSNECTLTIGASPPTDLIFVGTQVLVGWSRWPMYITQIRGTQMDLRREPMNRWKAKQARVRVQRQALTGYAL